MPKKQLSNKEFSKSNSTKLGPFDLRLFKGKSLREKLNELLPKNCIYSKKVELNDKIDCFVDSCYQLVGKDSVLFKEIGTLSIFVVLGYLGPTFMKLIARCVSVCDFARHYSVKNMKTVILDRIGGSGANDVDKVWSNVCEAFGYLFTLYYLKTAENEFFEDIFRKSRSMVENEDYFYELQPKNEPFINLSKDIQRNDVLSTSDANGDSFR